MCFVVQTASTYSLFPVLYFTPTSSLSLFYTEPLLRWRVMFRACYLTLRVIGWGVKHCMQRWDSDQTWSWNLQARQPKSRLSSSKNNGWTVAGGGVRNVCSRIPCCMDILLRPELKIMKALHSVNKFGHIHRIKISVTTTLLGWVGETALNLWRSLSAVAVYVLRYQSIRYRLDVMQ